MKTIRAHLGEEGDMKIEIGKEADKRIFSHTDCMCANWDSEESQGTQWEDFDPAGCEGRWTWGAICRDLTLTDGEGNALLSIRETEWRDWGNGQGTEREVMEILSSSVSVETERSADGLPRITEKIYRIGEVAIATATICEDGRNTYYRVHIPNLNK